MQTELAVINLWIPLELFDRALSTVKSSGSLAGAGSTVLDSPATMSQPKAIESSNDKSAAASNLEGTYCNIRKYACTSTNIELLSWITIYTGRKKEKHHLHTHSLGEVHKNIVASDVSDFSQMRSIQYSSRRYSNPKSSLAMWFEWWHSTSLLWAHTSPTSATSGISSCCRQTACFTKEPILEITACHHCTVYTVYIYINTITSSCLSCHTLPSLLHTTESLPSWNGAMMCHDRVSCSPCLHWFFGWSFGLQVSSHPLGPATPPGVSTSPKRSCNATRTIEGPLKVNL